MTCKKAIIEFLKDKLDGAAGGIIEDYVRENYRYKGSTVSRTCRLMLGKELLRRYDKGYVEYKLK